MVSGPKNEKKIYSLHNINKRLAGILCFIGQLLTRLHCKKQTKKNKKKCHKETKRGFCDDAIEQWSATGSMRAKIGPTAIISGPRPQPHYFDSG